MLAHYRSFVPRGSVVHARFCWWYPHPPRSQTSPFDTLWPYSCLILCFSAFQVYSTLGNNHSPQLSMGRKDHAARWDTAHVFGCIRHMGLMKQRGMSPVPEYIWGTHKLQPRLAIKPEIQATNDCCQSQHHIQPHVRSPLITHRPRQYSSLHPGPRPRHKRGSVNVCTLVVHYTPQNGTSVKVQNLGKRYNRTGNASACTLHRAAGSNIEKPTKHETRESDGSLLAGLEPATLHCKDSAQPQYHFSANGHCASLLLTGY